MHRKLFVVLCATMFLVGCKKEEVVETVPVPETLSIQSVTLKIGEEQVTYSVSGNEAVKSYTDKQIIVYPDSTQFDTVQVDYVQGNSLNDYIQAYYDGKSGDKSELIDGSFTTGTEAYCLKQTEDLNYIIVRGDKSAESFVNELCERL